MVHSRRPDDCSDERSRRKKSAARLPDTTVAGTVKNLVSALAWDDTCSWSGRRIAAAAAFCACPFSSAFCSPPPPHDRAPLVATTRLCWVCSVA
jgi:hypothetical protein